MIEDKVIRTMYVNVYQVERAYGGAEEGGWWYDAGTVLESKERLCACELPVTTWPILDEYGREGYRAELDTWFGNHDENECEAIHTLNDLVEKYTGRKDEWYPQVDGDDSEPRRGESFSSGDIRVRIELDAGISYPSEMPMYS